MLIPWSRLFPLHSEATPGTWHMARSFGPLRRHTGLLPHQYVRASRRRSPLARSTPPNPTKPFMVTGADCPRLAWHAVQRASAPGRPGSCGRRRRRRSRGGRGRRPPNAGMQRAVARPQGAWARAGAARRRDGAVASGVSRGVPVSSGACRAVFAVGTEKGESHDSFGFVVLDFEAWLLECCVFAALIFCLDSRKRAAAA